MRDRLSVEEATDLSAQLPALIRGVYFEGYQPANKPETYRSRDEFLQRVDEELKAVGGDNPEAATRAVFSLLSHKVSEGEIEDVWHMLPSSIRSLWLEK